VPGFITDALGFLLLVPPVRRQVVNILKRKAAARFSVRIGRFEPDRGSEIIDAEYEERPPRGPYPR
jgi:UPF0716 protein FxsA